MHDWFTFEMVAGKIEKKVAVKWWTVELKLKPTTDDFQHM